MEPSSFNFGFVDSAQGTSTMLMGALWIVMIMNMFLSGAMSSMVQWINSLQMMLHLPMMHLIMPANVSQFFELILPIAMFDIIESTFSTELVLEFDYDKEEEMAPLIYGQIQDLGYGSHNSILNLGSLAVFSFIYYIKVVLLIGLLYPLVFISGTIFNTKGFEGGEPSTGNKYARWLRRYHRNIVDKLIFSEILALSIEAYIEFIISGYLNLTV